MYDTPVIIITIIKMFYCFQFFPSLFSFQVVKIFASTELRIRTFFVTSRFLKILNDILNKYLDAKRKCFEIARPCPKNALKNGSMLSGSATMSVKRNPQKITFNIQCTVYVQVYFSTRKACETANLPT
jgi:hypothetical protein